MRLHLHKSAKQLCSFGSLYFAPDREQAGVLLHVLRELDVHVLLAAANCGEDMQRYLEIEIASFTGNKIMLAPFVPQQRVLHHEAISFFLTHGGSGAVMESIEAGVPMGGLCFIP